MDSRDDDPFGKAAHDEEHQDHCCYRGHECPEWDYLYICADCAEFEFCECFKEATNGKDV